MNKIDFLIHICFLAITEVDAINKLKNEKESQWFLSCYFIIENKTENKTKPRRASEKFDTQNKALWLLQKYVVSAQQKV